ncbi:hypothetical protein K3495_g6579 [Podosphaera aphanis]|nr:hypothetical protein K3495_g6579 [Podosphaera aphanis]
MKLLSSYFMTIIAFSLISISKQQHDGYSSVPLNAAETGQEIYSFRCESSIYDIEKALAVVKTGCRKLKSRLPIFGKPQPFLPHREMHIEIPGPYYAVKVSPRSRPRNSLTKQTTSFKDYIVITKKDCKIVGAFRNKKVSGSKRKSGIAMCSVFMKNRGSAFGKKVPPPTGS